MDNTCKDCKWYYRVIVEPKSHYSTCPVSNRHVDTNVDKCVDGEIQFCSCEEWEEIDIDMFDRLGSQPAVECLGLLRGVYVFCTKCGTRLFENMDKDDLISIRQLEEFAVCSDCLLKEVKEQGGDARDTD